VAWWEVQRQAEGAGGLMRALPLARPGDRLSVLCIGAHSDDIEIGLGGTLLRWTGEGVGLDLTWVVLSASGRRADEAKASAAAFSAGAERIKVELATFQDSYFPYLGNELKTWFHELQRRVAPDLIFTHRRDDAHQDHREASQLTWNAFRDHLILEYEIPKWDGDLSQPNTYVPIGPQILERKIALLHEHFATQRTKDWFHADTFRSLARLRGMECRALGGYAEAFTLRKARLS
jgi:LmbE family N-acetylglucosaminyl deacetylase